MSWRNHPIASDEETALLIEIAIDFMVQYFSYDKADAETDMEQFLTNYSQYYDEDTIHRELPYTMAAFVQHVMRTDDSYEDTYEWLLQSEYNEMPLEARDYYQRKYFTE